MGHRVNLCLASLGFLLAKVPLKWALKTVATAVFSFVRTSACSGMHTALAGQVPLKKTLNQVVIFHTVVFLFLLCSLLYIRYLLTEDTKKSWLATCTGVRSPELEVHVVQHSQCWLPFTMTAGST